jgi:hypothetical protein
MKRFDRLFPRRFNCNTMSQSACCCFFCQGDKHRLGRAKKVSERSNPVPFGSYKWMDPIRFFFVRTSDSVYKYRLVFRPWMRTGMKWHDSIHKRWPKMVGDRSQSTYMQDRKSTARSSGVVPTVGKYQTIERASMCIVCLA